MNYRGTLSRVGAPLGLTLILLCARIAAVPALSDPAGAPLPRSLHLHAPWLYVAFAPAFTLWDGISMLSLTRLRGFLVGLFVLYLGWRVARPVLRRITGGEQSLSLRGELRSLVTAAALLAGFLVAGALWHRPMLSLAGVDRPAVVVDFHSHTNRSHDVHNTWMRGFDAQANRRWHARAGFDAVFITDHNVERPGIRDQEPGTRDQEPGTRDQRRYPVLCPGIEVSAWRAHIVLLGDTLPVGRSPYASSLNGLLTLLRVSESSYGSLSVASLPEYRRNHWDRLNGLVTAGLDGFEIVNASPTANELGRAERDTVIALARARNRFVVGVSDSHGWGATSMVWNLVRIPSGSPGTTVCALVLRQLESGFPAVQVVERCRLRPDAWWPMWLSPVGVVWETWRSMSWALTISWLAWICAVAIGRLGWHAGRARALPTA